MSLVVSIPASIGAADGPPVSAGEWYPAIDPAAVRAAMRLGETVTPTRLRVAIVAAIATVQGQLMRWQAAQLIAGVAALAEVPAPAIDGRSSRLAAWERAVMSSAAADLVETHAEISATNDGLSRAGEIALPVEQHRRNAVHAIRDIRGVGRAKVVLI